MAAHKHAPFVDGTVCTFHDTVVDIVGTPEALELDDLIVREWLPIAPKRVHGRHWQTDWDDDWHADAPRDVDAVVTWELRRAAGGAFRLRIWPRYSRVFRGGPTDTDAPRRALARHQALVQARRDVQFQAFMGALGKGAAHG